MSADPFKSMTYVRSKYPIDPDLLYKYEFHYEYKRLVK